MSIFYRGRHRSPGAPIVTVDNLLQGHHWYLPTCGAITVRSNLSVESIMADVRRREALAKAGQTGRTIADRAIRYGLERAAINAQFDWGMGVLGLGGAR